MSDEGAEVINMAQARAEIEEQKRKRTERHKRRLLREKEGGPAYPGGIDDMGLGDDRT